MAKIEKYVCGLCRDVITGNFLLIEKKRPTWQKGKLNGVGGKIESKETATEAMIREFKEETGLDVTNWEPLIILKDVESNWMVYFFKAYADIEGHANLTDEPLVEVDPYDLPANLLDTMEWLIPIALSNQNPSGVIIVENQES